MQMPDFRRIARVALGVSALLGLLLGPWVVGEGPAGAKALPPVAVFWQVDSTAGDEGVYGVALTVLARSEFPELAVEMAVPAEFEVLEGNPAWSGPLARDETRTFALRVRVPAPGTITARVSGKTASNVQFSRTVSVDVPESQNEPTEAGKAGPASPPVSGDHSPQIRELPSR
jgi:hypothetical protein